MTTPPVAISAEVRDRMQKHFQSADVAEHPEKWSELWLEKFLPWDQGAPNPALIDLLAAHGADVLSLAPGKTVLVPGCGKGYDVQLFASYGLQAVGLDYAAEAVAMAREWVGGQTVAHPKGSMEFVQADFFKHQGQYDYVYDFTFLCALPPELRPRWAEAMAKLVKAGGFLVCLEFPLYKDPATGGPPWGLTSEIYVELLAESFERVMHFMPERTHGMGEGSDWMSVWKRK